MPNCALVRLGRKMFHELNDRLKQLAGEVVTVNPAATLGRGGVRILQLAVPFRYAVCC